MPKTLDEMRKFTAEKQQAAPDGDKGAWQLLKMWSETRSSAPTVAAMVINDLADAESTLADETDEMWKAVWQRDIRVRKEFVQWYMSEGSN